MNKMKTKPSEAEDGMGVGGGLAGHMVSTSNPGLLLGFIIMPCIKEVMVEVSILVKFLNL